MSKERNVELDIMKFWGILLVVLGHITNMYTPSGLIHPIIMPEWVAYISYFIYQFHMPLFVFVSGCVYAYQCEVLSRKSSFIGLIKKKSVRLLIPYFFFGILLVAFMMCLGLRDGAWSYLYEGIILSKDSRHLWYVLMLFEVFLLFWIIDHGVRKLRLPKWSLIFIAFLLFILANKIPYIFQLNNVFRYFFWFSCGYVFMLYKEVAIKMSNFVFLGGILVIGMLYQHQFFLRIPLISTMIAIAGILFFYHLSVNCKAIVNSKLYCLISNNSFGIYLYHVFVVYLWFYLIKDVTVPAYIMCLLSFVVSLFLSVILTQLTRKLGLGFIIGER